MQQRAINPWTWQDTFGFVQANETVGGERIVHCAGQTSVDGAGHPVHAGDIAAQANQALDNLETVLQEAGLSLAHIVRLNYYTTDVDAFLHAMNHLVERLDASRLQARQHPARRPPSRFPGPDDRDRSDGHRLTADRGSSPHKRGQPPPVRSGAPMRNGAGSRLSTVRCTRGAQHRRATR